MLASGKNKDAEMMQKYDVVIIGAGAAGLMCGIEAGKRGRRVLILDQANRPGKKILMSGGGRCNFTNYHITPNAYISHNPHFCKSALKRYTQWDFIKLVESYHIPFHEKTLGQLFCNNKANDILEMLLAECQQYHNVIQLNQKINACKQTANHLFVVETETETYQAQSLVIASGGLSIPTMGSSPFGYRIAEQFDIKIWPTRAGLVPLTWQEHDKIRYADLSGISAEAIVQNDRSSFHENILFTHRGMSGPAILQISSYWQAGESVSINFLPQQSLLSFLEAERSQHGDKKLKNVLITLLPKKMLDAFLPMELAEKTIANLSKSDMTQLAQLFHEWILQPNGSEGYRTAEVTLGGVDCDALSSQTMEAKKVAGLYFIGEVVDVTGWLGGYNFQWAWSSGWAAGQAV